MKIYARGLQTIILIALTGTASAEIVDWTFRGVVDTLSIGATSAIASSFAVGTPLEFQFEVDTAATPSLIFSSQGVAIYDLLGGSVTAGETHFDLEFPNLFIAHDPTFHDHTIALGGISFPLSASFTLQLTSSLDLPFDLDIPADLPLLSDFDLARRISILNIADQNRFLVSGTIDSIGVGAVPEPSSFGLIAVGFLLGLAAVTRGARRIRTSARE